MRRLLHIFFAVLFSFTASAQQDENWVTYMAQVEKKPASVLVNLALHDRPLDKQKSFLLITGPKTKNCQSNGLPAKEEILKLEEILDGTDAFITGVTAKVLAGTFTYNCERVNYYYVKDTTGLSFAMARLYKRSFSDYTYVYKIKYDPDWNVYRDFLYPTEENLTWIENNNIITDLIKQGDDLSKVRDINFIALFKAEADRKSFQDFAHRMGYRIDELSYLRKATVPYALKFSKAAAINSDIIAEMTMQIKKEVKKYKGVYEAWNCAVTK